MTDDRVSRGWSAAQVQRLAQVRAAGEELRAARARYRQTIIGGHLDGLTNVAMARELGVSEAAVRMYLGRAMTAATRRS